MQSPFDIAADLDTPVSAYFKLKAFRPRFLLESVEAGEQLGRYSFLGFGEALEVRLDGGTLRMRRPTPESRAYSDLHHPWAALAARQRPRPGCPYWPDPEPTGFEDRRARCRVILPIQRPL